MHQQAAYDTVIQALSGIIGHDGWPDGGPTRVGTSISLTSPQVSWATQGIVTALVTRERTVTVIVIADTAQFPLEVKPVLARQREFAVVVFHGNTSFCTVFGNLKITPGARTLRMHHPFGNALAVKVRITSPGVERLASGRTSAGLRLGC